MGSKPLHKLLINDRRMIFLDGKPIKGVQALQFTMDVRTPDVGVLQIVLLVKPDEINHDNVDVQETKAETTEKGNDQGS